MRMKLVNTRALIFYVENTHKTRAAGGWHPTKRVQSGARTLLKKNRSFKCSSAIDPSLAIEERQLNYLMKWSSR